MWKTRFGLQISTKFTGWFESCLGSFWSIIRTINPQSQILLRSRVLTFEPIVDFSLRGVRDQDWEFPICQRAFVCRQGVNASYCPWIDCVGH